MKILLVLLMAAGIACGTIDDEEKDGSGVQNCPDDVQVGDPLFEVCAAHEANNSDSSNPSTGGYQLDDTMFYQCGTSHTGGANTVCSKNWPGWVDLIPGCGETGDWVNHCFWLSDENLAGGYSCQPIISSKQQAHETFHFRASYRGVPHRLDGTGVRCAK